MRLPKLPLTGGKVRRQITRFGGLNRRDNPCEGELQDALGLTCAHYPVLTQRDSRETVAGYRSPTDIYEWDGHLVVVDGGVLYYDGAPMDNVTPGRKQFAVVNSNLVIWPDACAIDLTRGSYRRLDGSTKLTGAAITGHTLTFRRSDPTVSIRGDGFPPDEYTGDHQLVVYTYGKDADAIRWSEEGGWVLPAPEPRGLTRGYYPSIELGDIIIPSKFGNAYQPIYGTADGSGAVDLPAGRENNEGFFAQVEQISLEVRPPKTVTFQYYDIQWTHTGTYEWPERETEVSYRASCACSPTTGEITYYGGVTLGYGVSGTGYRGNGAMAMRHVSEGTRYHIYYGSPCLTTRTAETGGTFTIPLFSVGCCAAGGKLTDSYQPGDLITLRGTPYGLQDVEKARVTGVTDSSITLEEGTFPYHPEHVGRTVESIPAGEVICCTNVGNVSFHCPFQIPPGSMVALEDQAVVLGADGRELGRFPTNGAVGTPVICTSPYQLEAPVTVTRTMPELDFICESGNRLWGVSNAHRTIYASALGDPARFWVYNGVDTDSYAAAVGSEGDFTAIIAYGGGVCCWKSGLLHKVVGDYPSEYYMTQTRITGVQPGCHRSMAVVDEILYYKGPGGVYAYGGSTPTLISYPLGDTPMGEAAGGSDGRRYYLSLTDPGGSPQLLSYDLIHRLWMKEDNVKADCFTAIGNTVYMLSGGQIFRFGSRQEEDFPWLARFAPFEEGMWGKKGYTRLRLAVDMSPGSHMAVEIQEDRGPWRRVYQQDAAEDLSLNIPLPLGHCDRFSLRLSGRGRVAIRSLVREFSQR